MTLGPPASPEGDRKFSVRPIHPEVGGSARYVTEELARRGAETTLVGVVGQDEIGGLIGSLLSSGDTCTDVRLVPAGNHSARLIIDPTDGGDIEITASPSDGTVDSLLPDAALAIGADYAHLSCFPGTDRLRSALVGLQVPLVADFGFVPWRNRPELLASVVLPRLRGVAVAVFNGAGVSAATVDLAEEAVAAGVRAAVVTLGRDGAVVCDLHGTWYQAAPDVRVVNPVGAGDTLAAAFTHALHNGADAEEALRTGQAAAARLISRNPFRADPDEPDSRAAGERCSP
ncbi:carbohydrate kinase family protein [Streptomyces sp. NPDC046994]|uniref:carbohydrate kinase family protein n=1 Tax=Streptomyces sp. NPDC046994 TaxID=3155735 RepID=UPI0034573035